MASKARPISPHLQIYRPQISSVLSILHRATGIALTVGLLVLVWWLLAAASGPEAYATAQGFIGSFIGQILMFGWTFAFFFHLCNGIRHLFWDAGYGFDLPVMNLTGQIAVGASAGLTLLSWIIAYIVW
ncbi:succinate dehydrogenase, cytochrome b556 subunit [Fodinicurvata sp. EGI_FJ10296]|uniref:succinate dehydrogenase, cytochrome b556 subunit n=1 Tax=Fodinicurvata sp. EGI_FJ10296 TaxID=3231908 RepID=UPI003453FE2E